MKPFSSSSLTCSIVSAVLTMYFSSSSTSSRMRARCMYLLVVFQSRCPMSRAVSGTSLSLMYRIVAK